jgi:hypothetical protein
VSSVYVCMIPMYGVHTYIHTRAYIGRVEWLMKKHLFQKTEVLAVDLSAQNEAIKQKNYEKDNLKTKLQARKIYGHCNMIYVIIRYSA